MIQILDSFIADKIAAGEVIERPLSIVKELVENSIDAGASRIIVEIRNGGKSYIRVTDNGSGIPAEEVQLAFERHATGKIQNLEDLDHIATLGFRGEALASICAISRLTIFTKTADATLGTKLEIQGGRTFDAEPVGVNKGTTMVVEDVFYNTPARHKFMRSDAAEASAIIDFVQKMSIFYAGISFHLINNGKNILTTSGDGDYRNVITRVYPSKDFSNLLEIQGEYVHGYISSPGTTKTNRSGQIFFVNGRYIQSDIIEKGLMDGYGDRIFSGYPVAVLFISVPPESIDVNIHPNKKEIKFLEADVIKADLRDAVHKVIYFEEAIPETKVSENKLSNSIEHSTTDSKADSSDESQASESQSSLESSTQLGIRDFLKNKNRVDAPNGFEENRTSDAKRLAEQSSHPQEMNPNSSERTSNKYSAEHNTNTEIVYDIQDDTASQTATVQESENSYDSIKVASPTRKLFDFDELRVCGYVFNAYIITRAGDNLFVLDQHAAHERILYEKLIREYNNHTKLPQPILTPILLNTSSDVYCGERKWMDILLRIGYDIEDFGTNTFIIRGIPSYMDLTEAETFARETIDIKENEIHLHRNTPVVDKLIMRSCKAAVKANDSLSDTEIRDLLLSLSQCINPFSCPHGRPTFIRISKYDIERAFRRK